MFEDEINNQQCNRMIGGIPVFTASGLCKALGFNMSSAFMAEKLRVRPDFETSNGKFYTMNTAHLIVERLKKYLEEITEIDTVF